MISPSPLIRNVWLSNTKQLFQASKFWDNPFWPFIPTWSRQGNRRIHGGRSPICLFSPTKYRSGGPLVLVVVVLVVVVTLPCKNNLMPLRIWRYELCAYPVLIIPSIVIQRKNGCCKMSEVSQKAVVDKGNPAPVAGATHMSLSRTMTDFHRSLSRTMVKPGWKWTWKRTLSRGHFYLQLPTLFCGFHRSTSTHLSDSDL